MKRCKLINNDKAFRGPHACTFKKSFNLSAIAHHVTSTGHNLNQEYFEILVKGRSDTYCKIKETLLIRELKPTLNANVSSEELYLY